MVLNVDLLESRLFQDEFFVFLNLGIPHHLVKVFGIFGQANLGFCRG